MECSVEVNTNYNVTYTKYVAAYLYAVFIAVVFALPVQVQFGESVCFAYTFSLLQMTTLPLFQGNRIYLVVATLSATVLPSLQMVLAIDFGYDINGMIAFSTAYMVVQVSLYLLLRFSLIFRPRSIKKSEEWITIASVLLWLVTGLVLVFALIDPSESPATIDKYVYMVHYTPIFVVSVICSRMRV
jgi:hypothetical protein